MQAVGGHGPTTYKESFIPRFKIGPAKSQTKIKQQQDPHHTAQSRSKQNSATLFTTTTYLLPCAATASMLSAMSQMRSACGARFSAIPSCPPPAQQRYEQSIASSLYTWWYSVHWAKRKKEAMVRVWARHRGRGQGRAWVSGRWWEGYCRSCRIVLVVKQDCTTYVCVYV